MTMQQQEQHQQKVTNQQDNISVDTGFYSNKHNLSPSTIAKQLHRSYYSQGVLDIYLTFYCLNHVGMLRNEEECCQSPRWYHNHDDDVTEHLTFLHFVF